MVIFRHEISKCVLCVRENGKQKYKAEKGCGAVRIEFNLLSGGQGRPYCGVDK